VEIVRVLKDIIAVHYFGILDMVIHESKLFIY
jgi:hypothetical protein